LTRAEWDRATRELHLTMQAMNGTVAGQPTTLRVTGLDDPAAYAVTSPDGAPAECEVRNGELVLHTQVGGHALLVAPR